MASSGMLRRVVLVRTNVSEQISSATQCNFSEDAILYSHRHENLKSYTCFPVLYEELFQFCRVFL
jgi:hypothetical protein